MYCTYKHTKLNIDSCLLNAVMKEFFMICILKNCKYDLFLNLQTSLLSIN